MKKHKHLTMTMILFITAFNMSFGQIVPDLRSAANFAILAGTGISFAPPVNEINDLDVGLYPGVLSSITGMGNLTLNNGQIFAADQDPGNILPQAKLDLRNSYLFAAAATIPAPATISGNQGGKTLAPGIYKSTSTLSIAGSNLTLDAGGNENAVWIFQIASSLTTTVGGNVVLTGGAKANNVFWQVGASATLGNDTDFKGNILALISITMNTGATIDGRLLARNGAVTFAGGGTINKPEEVTGVSGEISITKVANPQTFSAVNDVIHYSITVQNTGLTTLTNIIVADDLTGNSWIIASLNAGQNNMLNTSYNITATDFIKGFVANIATAQVGVIQVNAYEVITREGLIITKVATPKTYSSAGQVITYDIVLENRGSVIIDNISVTDDLTGGIWTIPILGAGQSVVLSTTYTIVAGDLSNTFVENVVNAKLNNVIVASASELVTFDVEPPAVPISIWALALGIGLITIFIFLTYRRIL